MYFLSLIPGASTPIKHLSLRSMLPDTEHFMTYEGSTTHPGCWETTVWIILNKPIYITKHEVRNHSIKSINYSISTRLLFPTVVFLHFFFILNKCTTNTTGRNNHVNNCTRDEKFSTIIVFMFSKKIFSTTLYNI